MSRAQDRANTVDLASECVHVTNSRNNVIRHVVVISIMQPLLSNQQDLSSCICICAVLNWRSWRRDACGKFIDGRLWRGWSWVDGAYCSWRAERIRCICGENWVRRIRGMRFGVEWDGGSQEFRLPLNIWTIFCFLLRNVYIRNLASTNRFFI